jgi:ubiquinone/menaquinone biosynthesis C-methylase UbiE
MTDRSEHYVLATGEEGAYRLHLVNSVHGPDTEAFLLRAGLRPGMRVADIGCGIGTISCWMAEQVGPSGSVMGVDVSAGQVEQARQNAVQAGLANVAFVTASAYDTGLPSESFDLVFSRFLLMHLSDPQAALQEMARLLKPGGVLACEDGEFIGPFCEPPSPAFTRCFELYRGVVESHGADPLVGPKLYRMCLEAGFPEPEVAVVQPAFVRGDQRRLPEWTLAESAQAILEAGLATRGELDAILAELKGLAEEGRTLFGMARMTQVWARK